MAMPEVPRPRVPRARIGGLDTSKKPNPYQSIATKRNAQPLPPPPRPVERPRCCDTPEISTEDNQTLCYSCGKIFEESSIVAEVTFGETAGGAAIVEGGFIGDNQRHANSMGGTMRGLGGMESREQAAMHGRHAIEALAHSLQVRQAVVEQAIGWYKLAMNHNFIQGRRMRSVAAVAIYMASRRQPENTLMLMDLAEKIQTNVWVLGETYKAFLKRLGEEDPAQLIGNKAVQEIEPLMLKYCRKLEFEEYSHRVADDACKLLKRMNRDWMVQGRQPAGLCGACIIIAARMNNFRRSVREVVYVVKVADSTINARLYEYKKTPSSALSVQQFRDIGQRLKVTTQPPSVWRRAEKEERKEKRKARASPDDNDGDSVHEQSPDTDSQAGPSKAPLRASKRKRLNNGKSLPTPTQADEEDEPSDMLVTDTDNLDGNDDDMVDSIANAVAAKREPIAIDPEDLEIEQDIESELTHAIKDWEAIFKEFADNENHDLLQRTGWTAQEMARAQTDVREVPINLSPDIGEDEFEDDPDVANCLLGPAEVRRKEAIWLTENEDWLRDQQKKMLESELERAQEKPKKPKQKRRHHQMGDGSILEGQPATSAADAAHRMLKKRAKHFSNHIDYDRLKELFPGGNMAVTPSDSGQGGSPAPSHPAHTPPVVPVANVEHEEEDDEEEYEEMQEATYEDEDEDHEQQYLEDVDEGFGEDFDYE
ncbi:hypothetical protein IQ07DRAFT_580476 [Pyrenochaeta sp. DS3sAY3a]|nr:hypothetical protein IQ07DRAFT_580476 [Pyrenochaeta sp. DS3sAY3a]